MKKSLSFFIDWWRKTIYRWLSRDDTAGTDNQQIINEPIIQPNIESTNVIQFDNSNKKSRKSKPKSQIPETLSYLLEQIEQTFDSLRLPDDMKFHWVDKKYIKGLRKIGTHIASPDEKYAFYDDESKIRVDVSKPLPTMMCLSFHQEILDEEWMSSNLLFGAKIGKLPVDVEQHTGVPYVFGSAVSTTKSSLRGKLFWGHCFATINKKTGEIKICDERVMSPVRVPLARCDWKKYGKHRTIYTRKWDAPLYLKDKYDPETKELSTVEHSTLQEKNVIHMLFNTWSARSDSWSVGVSYGKNRVTFKVPQENTKHYFADRNKTIKAKDGKAKRIIHHVDAHTRTMADGSIRSVKEHIRGINEFDWNGYHCKVTAPNFNGIVSTAIYDGDPDVFDDEKPPNGFIEIPALAKKLAEWEDPRVAKVG